MKPFVCLLVLLVTGYTDDSLPPYKRLLNKESAQHVADLQKEISSLITAGKLPEAQKPAEEILRIRTVSQGKDHWQTVNAHFDVEMIKAVRKHSAAEQAAYAKLSKLQQEADALRQKG